MPVCRLCQEGQASAEITRWHIQMEREGAQPALFRPAQLACASAWHRLLEPDGSDGKWYPAVKRRLQAVVRSYGKDR